MNLIPGDYDIAARTIAGEARGEGYQGQIAVAHVLINRWKSIKGQFRRDDTLATACLRHLQFSPWNKGDPNFQFMYELLVSERAYRVAMKALLDALDSDNDPTMGAKHYHTATKPGWADAWPPDWAAGREPCAAIGRHLFYNDVP